MNPEDIQATLKRINSDLDRILKSRGWLHILNDAQEPLSFENSLGSAMFYACELKLKVNRILEQQKHKDAAWNHSLN